MPLKSCRSPCKPNKTCVSVIKFFPGLEEKRKRIKKQSLEHLLSLLGRVLGVLVAGHMYCLSSLNVNANFLRMHGDVVDFQLSVFEVILTNMDSTQYIIFLLKVQYLL